MNKVRYVFCVFMSFFVISCASTTPDTKEDSKLSVDTRPVCHTLRSTFRDIPTKNRICVQRQLFQPTTYYFLLDDELMYKGTDYKSSLVGYKQTYKDVTITGYCDELVSIVQGDNLDAVNYSDISKKIISECKIQAQADGKHVPFWKGGACTDALDKSNLVNVGARCIVKMNHSIVYDYNFILD